MLIVGIIGLIMYALSLYVAQTTSTKAFFCAVGSACGALLFASIV